MTPTRVRRLGRQFVMEDGRGEALVTAESVVRSAARRCGVSYDEVMGRSRQQDIVEARHEAVAALAHLGMTPAQIARDMGLCHATVLYHLGRLAGKRYEAPKGRPI